MEDEPLVITDTVLARILRGFALRLGLDDNFADALSQVHVQTSNIHQKWSRFLQDNCSSCEKAPANCEFMNPTAKNIIGDRATPPSMKHANMTMVEMGKFQHCPAYIPMGEE
jgi:hypothetical protein